MTARVRHLAAMTAALLAGAACEVAPLPPEPPPRRPRVTLAADPPTLGIGQRTVVRGTVTTAPGFRLVPPTAPETLAGFDVVRISAPPASERGSRWIHEVRFELRARSVGPHVWPAGSWRLAGPAGEISDVAFEALPIEVTSILPEFPGRSRPFGARAAHPPRARRVLPVAAGAAACLLLVATAGFAAAARLRARRARPQAGPAAPAPPAPPWTAARRELGRARALVPGDARGAANAAAAALRRYVDGRFGAATAAHTTEELALAAPPLAATSRWPELVSLLGELDAFRFPAPDRRLGASNALAAELVHRAETFVESSLPPEPLR